MGKHRRSSEHDSRLDRAPQHNLASATLAVPSGPAAAPAHAAAPPSERLAVAPARSSHIPQFLVRPHGAAGAADLDVAGSYRFPTRPTPVIRAAITLMGLDRVERASRPRAASYAYRCSRLGPAGERPGPTTAAPGAQVRSRRWPNV